VILVYRVPTKLASGRAAIRRSLKHMGALQMQQCACIMPDQPDALAELERVTEKIRSMAGEYIVFDVPKIPPGDEARTSRAFHADQARLLPTRGEIGRAFSTLPRTDSGDIILLSAVSL
jgi:hypothetical protein